MVFPLGLSTASMESPCGALLFDMCNTCHTRFVFVRKAGLELFETYITFISEVLKRDDVYSNNIAEK